MSDPALDEARKHNASTRRREEKMGFHGMRAFELAMNLPWQGRNIDPELALAAFQYDALKESRKEARNQAQLTALKEAIQECTPCPPLNLSPTPQPPAPLSTLPGYNTLYTPCPPLNLSQTPCPQPPSLLSPAEPESATPMLSPAEPESATPMLSPVPKGVVIEYEELD